MHAIITHKSERNLISLSRRRHSSPLRRHLANWTKQPTHRLWFCPFALLYQNMTSSTKPEIH